MSIPLWMYNWRVRTERRKFSFHHRPCSKTSSNRTTIAVPVFTLALEYISLCLQCDMRVLLLYARAPTVSVTLHLPAIRSPQKNTDKPPHILSPSHRESHDSLLTTKYPVELCIGPACAHPEKDLHSHSVRIQWNKHRWADQDLLRNKPLLSQAIYFETHCI